MSSPLTFLQLALIAGERAEMLVTGATTVELTDFINEGSVLYFANVELAALWDHMIMTNEDWAVKKDLIHLVSGMEEYNLPKDFYKMRKVFPLDSNGNRGAHLRRFQLQQLGKKDTFHDPVITGDYDYTYRVMGKRLFLDPIPSATNSWPILEIWYYHDYPHFENDTDFVPDHYPKGAEDYVIEGIAARFKEKVDEDSSPMRSRQKEVLARIMSAWHDRDVGEPHQMVSDDREYYW